MEWSNSIDDKGRRYLLGGCAGHFGVKSGERSGRVGGVCGGAAPDGGRALPPLHGGHTPFGWCGGRGGTRSDGMQPLHPHWPAPAGKPVDSARAALPPAAPPLSGYAPGLPCAPGLAVRLPARIPLL